MKNFSVKKLRVAMGALILSLTMPALAIDTTLSSQGAGVSGAINDGLFYSIGGGSVISPPQRAVTCHGSAWTEAGAAI